MVETSFKIAVRSFIINLALDSLAHNSIGSTLDSILRGSGFKSHLGHKLSVLGRQMCISSSKITLGQIIQTYNIK